MFIAALFRIAKIYKQCQCPSIGKQIKKVWCMNEEPIHWKRP